MAWGVVLKPSVRIKLSPALGYWRLVAKNITGKAISEELNAVARKGMTQVRRRLAAQTKMKYGDVAEYVRLHPAHAGNPRAVIRTKGRVPTLSKFMTSYSKRPVSWRKKGWRQTMRLNVWEGAHTFPKSGTKRPFVFKAKNGHELIGVRTGPKRKPVKTLSGPHLPNEVLRKGKPTSEYVTGDLPRDFEKRVIARIQRIMGGGR